MPVALGKSIICSINLITNEAMSSTKMRAKVRKMMAVMAPVWKRSKKGVVILDESHRKCKI